MEMNLINRLESFVFARFSLANTEIICYNSQEPGARSQEPGARSQEPGARKLL
jgi:hypothetical protein